MLGLALLPVSESDNLKFRLVYTEAMEQLACDLI